MTLSPHLLAALAATAFFSTVGAHGASADANATEPRPMMGSMVFKWEELTVKATPKGESRTVANNPTPTLATFESHITTLNPGQASHDPHRHPQEELIIVKEGTLEVYIEGR